VQSRRSHRTLPRAINEPGGHHCLQVSAKASEAPYSVSIISADDIKRYGYRTLADALKSLRGVYVAYDRNYSYIGTARFGRPVISTPVCCCCGRLSPE